MIKPNKKDDEKVLVVLSIPEVDKILVLLKLHVFDRVENGDEIYNHFVWYLKSKRVLLTKGKEGQMAKKVKAKGKKKPAKAVKW